MYALIYKISECSERRLYYLIVTKTHGLFVLRIIVMLEGK